MVSDVILLTKFDCMWIRHSSHQSCSKEKLIVFYHLLETDEGFHIRSSDNNMGFSLYRSHRKDLKQGPCVLKKPRACSHGIRGPWRGEVHVPHLPVVKKYLSSHATLGMQGGVEIIEITRHMHVRVI